MKKIILGIIAIIVLGFCLFGVATCHGQFEERQEILRAEQELLFDQELNDVQIPEEWYKQDGYDNISKWWEDLIQLKEENSSIASDVITEVGSYLSEEQKQQLAEYSDIIISANSIQQINDAISAINEIKTQGLEAEEAERIAEEAAQQQELMAANADANAFKNAGVLYANGYKYTYYSSNQLYHYMTSQWNLGTDGIYRDNNGYIIVASSTHKQGTTVPTPFGTGIVRDSGCAAGTLDIYTAF